jgi:hypothetical protein
MIKAKFSERLLCKTETAQINEALCKVLFHNLCGGDSEQYTSQELAGPFVRAGIPSVREVTSGKLVQGTTVMDP